MNRLLLSALVLGVNLSIANADVRLSLKPQLDPFQGAFFNSSDKAS